MDNNVVGGGNSSLADMLRHQEEIKPMKNNRSNNKTYNRARLFKTNDIVS